MQITRSLLEAKREEYNKVFMEHFHIATLNQGAQLAIDELIKQLDAGDGTGETGNSLSPEAPKEEAA